jgi:hypothetical protein
MFKGLRSSLLLWCKNMSLLVLLNDFFIIINLNLDLQTISQLEVVFQIEVVLQLA